MKLCIDIGVGLGGFSDAFRLDPQWEVVGIDINKKFNPTICADVRYIPLREGLEPDCLLMSPPCERFSIACRTWPKMGIKKAMEIVGACLEAVAYLKPKKWLLENPMGRLRWFLGKPGITIRYCDYGAPYQKKTDLWGNICLPMLNATCEAKALVNNPHKNSKGKLGVSFQTAFTYGTSGHTFMGKALRAKVPSDVSLAVKQGVEVSA